MLPIPALASQRVQRRLCYLGCQTCQVTLVGERTVLFLHDHDGLHVHLCLNGAEAGLPAGLGALGVSCWLP